MNDDLININGVDYLPVDQIKLVPNGNRAVVVIDRGWIFAGDVTEHDGRIRIDRAVWVFRWESVGFQAMIDDPKNIKVDLRPMALPVDLPSPAEIFRVPVADDWGL